jgi:hypothetical protein
MFAVAETVPVEKPVGAASTLFAPLWVIVDVLVCKIYGPRFIHEHAKFGLGVLVLDDVAGIVSFLALILALLVFARLRFRMFASFLGGGFFWGYHLERGMKIHVEKAKITFETIEEKSMIESFTLFLPRDILHSFSQIW